MLETYLVAFTTFFAVIGPPDVAVLFAALAARTNPSARRRIALRATVVAGLIMLAFAAFGQGMLHLFGISLAALRAAGGILLLLIAIDMVFARQSGGITTTSEENAEAETRADISIFPLATPLIAGPGTIGASILLMASAVNDGDALKVATIIAAMLSVLVLTYVLMLASSAVNRLLGVTGVHVVARVFGIILAALAVQFIFDGIKQSGLVG